MLGLFGVVREGGTNASGFGEGKAGVDGGGAVLGGCLLVSSGHSAGMGPSAEAVPSLAGTPHSMCIAVQARSLSCLSIFSELQ